MENIRLNADARTALKQAIREHTGFSQTVLAAKEYRDWTKSDILGAARILGIDVAPFAAMTAQVIRLGADSDDDDAADAPQGAPAITDNEAEQQAAKILAMPLAARISEVAQLVVKAATPQVVEKIVEKTVEVQVEVPVSGGAPRRVVSAFKPTITMTRAATLFPVLNGMTEGAWMIPVYNDPTAPKVDPHYVWRPQVLVPFLAGMLTGENVWLSGDASTGKTSLAQQIAAVTKRAFVRVNFNRATTQDDLVGSMGVTEGTTHWQDGSITAAIQRAGAIVVLDEVTNTRPANHATIQAVLEKDGALVISTIGRTVQREQGVMFVAADNTNGKGDEHGIYLDTLEVNAAFRDRFSISIAVPYMEVDQEAKLLRARTGLPLKAARLLTSFADKCRAARMAGNLREPVTHRTLMAWSESLKLGMAPAVAFETTVAGKATIIDAEALRQLHATHVDPAKLQDALGIDASEDQQDAAGSADTSILANAGTDAGLSF